ncbi:MAG: hypothetical protein KME15_26360 [Drouetiella hepatica Uher 2000/2452]|jgi:hypothetical protein|uniref:Uncharacterized protein n=1 Tax=Drouetiella hepatica Uher 2000/2452 TaxID=904376 RepID=A0A951QI18_9CYAN|nr:hypothetical protein [Drouetiella hepatica Uher 2000/2452]
MATKKKLPHLPETQNKGRIPASATQGRQDGSTDDQHPSFRFTNADGNRYKLSAWKPAEIDDLIGALKKIEKHTWAQIKSQGSKNRGESVGCGFKIIENHPQLPASISEDINISEMRVCQKKRIFGFRIPSSPIYCIVWFDRDHSVCRE